jgi:hypothetical protein
MSNELKIEQLRVDINQSKLLDDHEKADWLNLLELMNDKQIGELEEILKAPVSDAEAPATGPTITDHPKIPVPPKSTAMPALSHISNLPTAISYNKPKPSKPVPMPKLVMPDPAPSAPLPIKAPPLQAARPQGPQGSPYGMPAQGKGSIVNLSGSLKDSMVKPQPLPTPMLVKRPDTEPGPGSRHLDAGSVKEPLQIRSLEDVAGLDLTMFRTSDHSLVQQNFQQLVLQFGYFNVLHAFEKSKLYKSYLNRGRSILSGESTEGKFTVNQGEFELIADILQSIRINRQR